MSEKLIQELVQSVNRLAATEPSSENVASRVKEVFETARKACCCCCEPGVETLIAPEVAPGEAPVVSDPVPAVVEPVSVVAEIDRMRSAAVVPASNYSRIVSILDGLRHVALLAERPQNVAVRPQVASIIEKVAGIFGEVDTVKDLDKPLEQIEKAVHSLYKNQSRNDCGMFSRRTKKADDEK